MAKHFDAVLEEQNFSRDQIYKAFRLDNPQEKAEKENLQNIINTASLIIERYTSINDVNKREWNAIFENKGSFDYDGLKFLESTFKNNDRPENNWEFDYLIIKDKNSKKVVLATFFTTALCKDDMLSHEALSNKIEAIRKLNDPYYLTSMMVMTGSLTVTVIVAGAEVPPVLVAV